jgi:hypothetical protein
VNKKYLVFSEKDSDKTKEIEQDSQLFCTSWKKEATWLLMVKHQ